MDEDVYSFRTNLFDQLKDPFLYESSSSDYESKVSSYLDSIKSHSSYQQLDLFSKKLDNLKGLIHFFH